MATARNTRRPVDASMPRTGSGAVVHDAAPAVRGALVLGAFVALHLVLLLVIFPNTREDEVLRGNLWLFFRDSGRTLAGAVPYRDFLLEYPPGSLLFMLAPRFFAVGPLAFRTLFFVEIAALDVVILYALRAIARGAGRSVAGSLALYTLAVAAIGPLILYRLDLAPAALTVLAILAWQRNRPALAAIILAAGTATKAYPLLLLPPLLIDEWLRGQGRRAARAALAFVAGLAVFLSPIGLAALLSGMSGLVNAIRFQADRHLQVESIWAIPPLLLHLTTGFAMEIVGRGRALVILGPGDVFGQFGTPVLALVALAIYCQWWRLRRQSQRQSDVLLIGTAALIIAAAILTKVLSPQYLLWIMPAMALLPLRSRPLLVALVAFYAALPLTQWVYPMHYGELVRLLSPRAVGVLILRNLLLVVSLAALLLGFWRLGHASRQAEQ